MVNKPKEVTCPSGAKLVIHLAPFVDSKNLYQALLLELRKIEISAKMEMAVLYKDLFCIGFASQTIEAALMPCLQRCTYNGMKVDQDTFEPESARGDYMNVCMEVATVNVVPFGKSLYAEYQRILATIEKSPA